MEAAWEVELGGEAPVIEAIWPGFVDLRLHPEQAWQLPEAAQLHALALLPSDHGHIDLTPSKVGKMCIPAVNLEECLDCRNVIIVSCGGQTSIPLAYVIGKTLGKVNYVEVVSSIASRSAGSATRINLDEYIETTEQGVVEGIVRNATIHAFGRCDAPVKICQLPLDGGPLARASRARQRGIGRRHVCRVVVQVAERARTRQPAHADLRRRVIDGTQSVQALDSEYDQEQEQQHEDTGQPCPDRTYPPHR